MNKPLSTIEIAPTAAHEFSIIWLHGLGADGHDFEAIVPDLNLNKQANIHFIFPNAPVQLVTVNDNMAMRSWYDILDLSSEHRVDIDDIYQSAALITELIKQEIDTGIASDKILLAGFSQGGVLVLHIGLSVPAKLAGIVALSTYLPTLDRLKAERSEHNQDTPIFIGHGADDSIIDCRTGQKTYRDLKALEYPVEWHLYPMQHSVCQQEIADIATFINGIF